MPYPSATIPQNVQHGPQRRRVHPDADAQPLAGRQHQLQGRLRGALLLSRPPVHQSKPHRTGLLEPFPPRIEAVLRQSLFLTKLLHGNSAALLCSDSFGPLVRFRVDRLRLDDSVAHNTIMRAHRHIRKSGSPDAY